MNNVIICVLSAIEPPLPECLAAVEAQEGGPYRVVHVENVFPLSAAFNAMIERCDSRFIVQVDGDILLAPWAVRTLLQGIRPWDYVAWGQTYEPGFGEGGAVRLWRRWPLRIIRFRDRRTVDRDLHNRVSLMGLQRRQIRYSVVPNIPFGAHQSRTTPFARFSKAKGDALKWIHLGRTDLHEAFRLRFRGDFREESYPERLGLYAASISTARERSKNLREDWWEYQRLCASYSQRATSFTGAA